MAKGLKIGDVVTVRKEHLVPKDEAAYQAGLTKVEPGQHGRIVKVATARGFVVEFDSREVVLSSQSLDIWQAPPAEVVTAKVVKSGKKAATKKVTAKVVKPARKTAAKVVPVVLQEVTSTAVADAPSNITTDVVVTPNTAQDIVPEEPPAETVTTEVVKPAKKAAAKTITAKAVKPGKDAAAKVVTVVPPEPVSVKLTDATSNINTDVSTASIAAPDVLAEEPDQQNAAPVEPTTIVDKVDKQENLLDYLNLENEGFVRLVANALLLAGNSPDVVLLSELRFVDLPEPVQQRVQTLIRAKLALTLK
jgi:translation elongation factor P/translation initiation factor 5A